MVWDGTAGQGAYVNWHGSTSNGWGVLHDGEVASGTVDVTLSTEFAGDMTIAYTIGGDGYGEEPHLVDGEIILEYPLRWINLNMSSGTLAQGQSQEIIIHFNTDDVPQEVHSCNIVITSDSWDGKTIPITLTPIVNDNDPGYIPAATALQQNYPNPFNPETVIPYSISETANRVTLKIYNMKGQLINTLKDAPAAIGNYKLTWNGTDESGSSVSSGIYFYKLAVDGNTLTRKMILIK
jgi:hypothetical protein